PRGACAPALLAPPASKTFPGAGARACILTGKWTNELNSNMTIFPVNLSSGMFTGSYLTAVTSSNRRIRKSPMHGSQQLLKGNGRFQPTFGFTVKWEFTESITVFVGQCFLDEDGRETLETMWLLRSKGESHGDNWKQTLVGTNTFRRLP
uniref:Avidin n=1 Tax=Varanus komodoensis TaxID=61221 RepID=A0A8D2L4W1_VARKO